MTAEGHPATRELDLPSRRATRRLGAALAVILRPGDVVWLEGDLGAGKTFFARGLLSGLGVPDAVPVTSPTFALVHEHSGRLPIRHLDLYRLEEVDELRELGLEEALDEAVTVIEWGKRLRDGIGARGIEIELRPRDEATGRVAALRALDARGQQLLESLDTSFRPRASRP